MTQTYTCDHCGETFDQPEGWTEEDKLAEEKEIFSRNTPEDQRKVICDYCWRIMMMWAHTLPIEERIEMGIRHLPPLEDLLAEMGDISPAKEMMKDIL